MYAEVKNLPLTRVSVTLSHEKVEIDGKGKIDRISRRISLEGDLTLEQRNRMLEIANRCPIHRTLSGNLEIASSLANEG
ncbi:MAG: putative redox protein, partial [Pseudomonadota bacterium]|nr:putative redox protein [Pseudomonadota bacterium]